MTGRAEGAGPRAWTPDTLDEEDWIVPWPPDGPDGRSDPVARVAHALRHGPGLALVRGLALDGLGDPECAELCRRFAARLGTVRPLPAGPAADDLLTAETAPAVELPATDRTTDRTTDGTAARAAQRDGDARTLDPHTDRSHGPESPWLLGLLCIRPARAGGESLLVSARAVHDRLAEQDPSALHHLYQDFHFGRGPDFDRVSPVFQQRRHGLHVQYNRYWIERGQQETGRPFPPGRLAALDTLHGVLTDPGTVLRVPMRRGDLLLLDNTAVLHGRTGFSDPVGPGERRCLARVWADRPADR
ncbi:Taurine catabolism dioxygenase TauD, TfdA family [Streptomyces sp. TLI_053]|uniref:TauD/TfdA family dioxygenase n=1 Tax=Streptomyces sp. TLI_053 TaxID=1855352 RepID=UPI00087CA720|nr:TauD/TfdA family dioxygenase [Streptomyces sp. TLI_053]SDS68408.1 Taurine catabolism dioxygenase TauD, TfdA family [Streptomyces sp. TLI_053]